MVSTEAETLELYRNSLMNAESQPVLLRIMSEFGYGPDTIAKGKAMLEETLRAYYGNKTENDEYFAAYNTFSAKKEKLYGVYAMDRKKAKVVFRNNPIITERLGIRGNLPRTYMNWLETVRKFYTTSLEDPTIQTHLTRLKITLDHLIQANTLIMELEASRTQYLREKGESQDATKLKDEAISRLDEWMRDFYSVAKIALEDRPQLVESLGKLVRS